MRLLTYVAERTIQYYEDFDEFCKWIKTLKDVKAIEDYEINRETKTIKLRSRHGMSAGLYRGIDPINALVILSMVLFREYWIYMPDTKQAFKIVQDWFRKKVREGRKYKLHES